jgi:hypothetical protein
MKHLATVALMLNLGVAGIYAQQGPGTMTFSGTGAPSTINLQYPGTNNSEDNSAGNGTLGPFTFRNVRAVNSNPLPQPPSTCSGSTFPSGGKNDPVGYFLSVAGAAVFRFQDGSLLKVTLMQALAPRPPRSSRRPGGLWPIVGDSMLSQKVGPFGTGNLLRASQKIHPLRRVHC